ncbi:MAG: hypothetical protein HGN29_13065 [Asgard group archaeon]|nr:hypothetical protein [Asgard group archaeon]
MSSFTILHDRVMDLGVVLVKFDHRLGPIILSNHSSLAESTLMNLAIKGTSTLMNGLTYNFTNSRRFRGLMQLSENTFVYGFDLLLLDDNNDKDSFTPVILFLVFPSYSVSVVGSNIRKIEQKLYEQTQNLITISNIEPRFGLKILSEFQGMMF